jgi:hypothetical protein
VANCLVLTKVDADLAPSAQQSTAQGPSRAAHLHPSGVAEGHEPLIRSTGQADPASNRSTRLLAYGKATGQGQLASAPSSAAAGSRGVTVRRTAKRGVLAAKLLAVTRRSRPTTSRWRAADSRSKGSNRSGRPGLNRSRSMSRAMSPAMLGPGQASVVGHRRGWCPARPYEPAVQADQPGAVPSAPRFWHPVRLGGGVARPIHAVIR